MRESLRNLIVNTHKKYKDINDTCVSKIEKLSAMEETQKEKKKSRQEHVIQCVGKYFETRYIRRGLSEKALTILGLVSMILIYLLLFAIPVLSQYIKNQNTMQGVIVFFKYVAQARCFPIIIEAYIITEYLKDSSFRRKGLIMLFISATGCEIIYDLVMYQKLDFTSQSQAVAFFIAALVVCVCHQIDESKWSPSLKKLLRMIFFLMLLFSGAFVNAQQFYLIIGVMYILYIGRNYKLAAALLIAVIGSLEGFASTLLALVCILFVQAPKSHKSAVWYGLICAGLPISYVIGGLVEAAFR